MSVQYQLQAAEEAVRQSLINALAEGEDQYLTDLFNLLNSVQNMNKKVSNTIRYTDNVNEWENKMSEFNFSLSSDYLDNSTVYCRESDSLDNIISFPQGEHDGNITIS